MKIHLLNSLLLLITFASCSNQHSQRVAKEMTSSMSSNNTDFIEIETKDNTITTMTNPSSAFITTWKTIIDNDSITILINPNITSGYDYQVDWGDGSEAHNLTTDATHQYVKAGTYTVKITGDFPAIYSDIKNLENASKLQTIEQWGSIAWQSMEQAFYCSRNLVYKATDVPDLSDVTNMNLMFSMTNHFNGDIGSWDVSTITDMKGVFAISTRFNQDISNWDVSNVKNMEYMFSIAKNFNQNIGAWNVSNVTAMSGMFRDAFLFNGDISSWDVSNVLAMDNMFSSAESFNQNVSAWNTYKVTDMGGMFVRAKIFSQDLSGWKTDNVTSCGRFSTDSGLVSSQLPTAGDCF